jgi:hypothetical protein
MYWNFRRAPGVFDIVAYTGTGSARTVAHNLGVVPELMIVKCRNNSGTNWIVYFGDPTDGLKLNLTNSALDDASLWNDTAPTSSVFTVGSDGEENNNNNTYYYKIKSSPMINLLSLFFIISKLIRAHFKNSVSCSCV